MRFFIICGEISGDVYAYHLTKAFKKASKNTEIIGVGGEKLKSIADTFLFSSVHHNIIGIGAFFQKFTIFKQLYKHLLAYLETHKVEKVILIDFHYHNIKLANLFKRFNIPVIIFITPNFWIWKDRKQALKLIQVSDVIITIYKKEYDFYASLSHKPVYFVGHPMMSITNDKEPCKPLKSTKPIITLFPGSRKQELKLYLRPMLKTALLMHQENPKASFYLALSSNYFRSEIQKVIAEEDGHFIHIWEQDNRSLFKYSDCLVCASGTSTLQGVVYQTPMIILAALPHVTYFFAKYIWRLNLPFITLPNIIAEKIIVPEIIQYKIKPKIIYKEIKKMLKQTRKKTLLKHYKLLKLEYHQNVFDKLINIIRKHQ